MPWEFAFLSYLPTSIWDLMFFRLIMIISRNLLYLHSTLTCIRPAINVTDIASPTLTRSSSSVKSAAVGWCRVVDMIGTAVVFAVIIEYVVPNVEFMTGVMGGAIVVVDLGGLRNRSAFSCTTAPTIKLVTA